MVVAVINPECFYNFFISAPPVVSDFQYQYCFSFNLEQLYCTLKEYQLQTTTFDPPYNYSYQCSSQFITYYAPAFIFLCIVEGLVVPLSQLLRGEFYKFRLENKKGWSLYLGKFIPRIFQSDLLDEKRYNI